MVFFLSRSMPRWLARVCWPDNRLRLYLLLFLSEMAVLVVLQRAGLDSATVIGWMVVISGMSIDTVSRLYGTSRGTPGLGRDTVVGGE